MPSRSERDDSRAHLRVRPSASWTEELDLCRPGDGTSRPGRRAQQHQPRAAWTDELAPAWWDATAVLPLGWVGQRTGSDHQRWIRPPRAWIRQTAADPATMVTRRAPREWEAPCSEGEGGATPDPRKREAPRQIRGRGRCCALLRTPWWLAPCSERRAAAGPRAPRAALPLAPRSAAAPPPAPALRAPPALSLPIAARERERGEEGAPARGREKGEGSGLIRVWRMGYLCPVWGPHRVVWDIYERGSFICCIANERGGRFFSRNKGPRRFNKGIYCRFRQPTGVRLEFLTVSLFPDDYFTADRNNTGLSRRFCTAVRKYFDRQE